MGSSRHPDILNSLLESFTGSFWHPQRLPKHPREGFHKAVENVRVPKGPHKRISFNRNGQIDYVACFWLIIGFCGLLLIDYWLKLVNDTVELLLIV